MTKKSFAFDTETIGPLITAGLKFVEELANASNRDPVTDLNDKIGEKLNGDIYETWDDVPYGVEVEDRDYRLVKVEGWEFPLARSLSNKQGWHDALNNIFHRAPYFRVKH